MIYNGEQQMREIAKLRAGRKVLLERIRRLEVAFEESEQEPAEDRIAAVYRALTGDLADHPHTDPGDGRSQCDVCGKWVWPVTHSCKGVSVVGPAPATPDDTAALRHRLQSHDRDCCPCVPQFRAELYEARDALAVAEAERDAYAAALAKVTHEFHSDYPGRERCSVALYPKDRCYTEAGAAIHQTPAVVRRALAQPEGGSDD